MKQTIKGEAPFQVLATNFSISPSNEGYTLQISADGTNYSDLFAVGSDTTRMVTGVSNGSYFRLKGNESTVVVNWVTQCSDGGSGGGGTGAQGPQGPQGATGPQGPEGPAGSGGTIDSGAVQTQIDRSINANNEQIEEGEIIVGMAKQLYSPDGVTSEGEYFYRTTAGDEDVSTGIANLKKVEGNATFPETTYNDSAVLMRDGSEVEGFDTDFFWGDNTIETQTSFETPIGVSGLTCVKVENPWNGRTYKFRIWYNEGIWSDYSFTYNNGVWTGNESSKITQIDANNWYWHIASPSETSMAGTAVWDAETLSFTFTQTNGFSYSYIRQVDWNGGAGATDKLYYITGENIPNDIPIGETTYTYSTADTAWTPSLPQAVSSMTLNSETYVPQDGDEIVINRYLSALGSVVYAQPSKFVALGLNSFDYTCEGILTTLLAEGKKYSYDANDGEYRIDTDSNYNTYAIYAVTGLENGYVIHMDGGSFNSKTAGVADTNVAVEVDNADFDTTIENGNLIVYPTTAMPYIILSVPTADADKVCVHPRWSGYRDEDYEDYAESSLDISAFNTECPLISIGDTRNEWDFENMKLINKFETSAYSAEAVADLIEDGKVLGEDFEFDEDYIYVVAAEPTEIDITDFDNEYQDNDFSVEYLTDENDELLSIPVEVTTWYMNNLTDKLRRMRTDFIHLDDPNTAGEVGKTYEYQGRIMKWVEGSGYTAEWLKSVSSVSDGEGTGLVYAIIPDGQTLFEFRTGNSDAWRKVIYSGDTLYYTETGGTVVSAVTIGKTFIFEGISYPTLRRIKGVYENGYIGFLRNANLYYIQNVWDGRVEGGHYELIDKYNYPYLANGDNGIPSWNEKGQIIRKNWSVSTKDIYINATGTSLNNRTTVLTNGTNNGPDRWFAPITGGDTGQTLVSAGANAAPVWETRIKVVKITSDAYEALQNKDANTLYVIDDES